MKDAHHACGSLHVPLCVLMCPYVSLYVCRAAAAGDERPYTCAYMCPSIFLSCVLLSALTCVLICMQSRHRGRRAEKTRTCYVALARHTFSKVLSAVLSHSRCARALTFENIGEYRMGHILLRSFAQILGIVSGQLCAF